MIPPKSKEEVVQEFRIQSIQEAAIRVIARKGMAAATMQDIAEEAGVAKGTIYLYFRDRDELVDKTMEGSISRLIGQVDAAIDSAEDIEGKIRGAISAKFAFFRENREFFRLYSNLRHPEGPPRHAHGRQKHGCQPRYDKSVARFVAVLEAAMDQHEIRRMNAQRLALFIIEGSNAIVVERVMEQHSPDELEDVDLLMDVIMGGIRNTGAQR